MLKIIIKIIGVICIILGIILGVLLGIAMLASLTSVNYLFSYSNTLSGVAQEMIILFTNLWLIFGELASGLLFLMPIKFGRLIRIAGYTVPDEEVIPKSYRTGGLYLIIAGIMSLVAHFFLVRAEILLIPLLAVFLGIIAVFVSIKSHTK
jgi:hypothetical protein